MKHETLYQLVLNDSRASSEMHRFTGKIADISPKIM